MTDIIKVVLVLMIALLSACAVRGEKMPHSSVSELTVCSEPRPQICTREYNPVCATYKGGHKKTGATGCTACSDPEVIGYTMGACEAIAVE